MFDILTRSLLEKYTLQRPPSESAWYGPWTTILTRLFPSEDGYVVTPQRKVIGDDTTSVVPDFIIEVVYIKPPIMEERIVLIVEIKNSQHWPKVKEQLVCQVALQIDNSFAETARDKVYFIATIGPHWCWGEGKMDGQQPRIIGSWRDTIHDKASYRELKRLVEHVHELD